MSDFSVILDHPLSKEIIGKLIVGSSAKEVSQWLKIKYPDKNQSHLRLTQKILKEFADSQYTQYYDQFLEDKKIVASGEYGDKDVRMSAALANNKFYRERMEELVDQEINMIQTCQMVAQVLHSRMEQLFDLTQQDVTDIGKADNTFIRYVQLFVDTADRLERMKLNKSDDLDTHNITMEALQQYLQIYQDVIRETLAEVDIELSNRAMEKLFDKLNSMEAPEPPTPQERAKMANEIEAKVLSIENLDD